MEGEGGEVEGSGTMNAPFEDMGIILKVLQAQASRRNATSLRRTGGSQVKLQIIASPFSDAIKLLSLSS